MSNVLKAHHINLSYSQPFLAKYPDEFTNDIDDINKKKERRENASKGDFVKASSQIEEKHVVTKAKVEAQKILKDARVQAEEIRQSAYDLGYEKGYSQGKDTGYLEGKREAKIEYEELLSQIHEQKKDLEKRKHRMIQDVEGDVVNLSLSIAKKIVSYELGIQPKKVLSMVRCAIDECNAEGKKILKVSPQDFDKVVDNKSMLGDLSNQGGELVIQKDERLSKGDCSIETDTGLVDAKVDTQLQLIREAFMSVGVGGNYDA